MKLRRWKYKDNIEKYKSRGWYIVEGIDSKFNEKNGKERFLMEIEVKSSKQEVDINGNTALGS